ncbi:MAG: MopE-related protein, partial [Acidobacteriota bacterium]|nr:MopE-related protein [Acidobacteriota bacterium]
VVFCPDDDADGYAVCDGSCELEMGDQCGDCDDADGTVNPDGVEGPFGDATCSDVLDNDCDGSVDSADGDCDAVVVFCPDDDADGYAVCEMGCELASGSQCGDCDDTEAAVNPAATEGPPSDPSCTDDLDNDCDGMTDLGDADCEQTMVFCVDEDLDGYAICDDTCYLPVDTLCGDCDDSDSFVNPGAAEGPFMDPTCDDELDNDCDGFVDLDETVCTEPTLSDYDIVFFRCSHQAKVGKRVSLRITIENQLDTDPGAELTVYGTRSDGTNIPIVMGLEIFDRTDHGPLGIGGRTARASKAQRGSRSPNPASGRSRPRFTYTATADDIGWVTWMAEILDGTPGAEDEAEDTASCVTRIRKDPSNHGDDDDDDGHDDDRDESEDDDE